MSLPPARVVVALVAMGAVIALLRLHTFDEPLQRDLTTYSLIGDGLRAGRLLYADLWDHKPPAIHYTFALGQLAFGPGNAAMYGLGVAAAFLTLLGVYAAASTRGEATGLLAAGLWCIYAGEMQLEANQPNTEVFINVCLIWALAGYLRMRPGPRRLGLPLAVGGLMLVAALYKQTCLVYALAFGAVHVLRAPPARRGAAGLQACVVLAVVAMGFALVGAGFAAAGVFSEMWDAVIRYNAWYAGSVLDNLVLGLRPVLLAPPIMQPLLPLLVVSLLGTVAALFTGRLLRRDSLLLLAYGAANLLFIASPGKFFPHYYQVWLPLLTVTSAFAVHLLAQTRPRPALACAAVLLAASLAAVLPEYRLDAVEWSRQKYGDEFTVPTDLGRRLAGLLEPGETVFELGADTEFYYYSGHPPPSGVLYSYGLVGPLAPVLSRRLVADLDRRLPDLLVVRVDNGLSPTHPVLRWLAERYGPLPSPDDPRKYVFIPRPGSALADRIQRSGAQWPSR